MERESSAALHRKMNPEVAKLVEQGCNLRKAYRVVAHAKSKNKEERKFDYERETPKGEWV